MKTPKIQVTPDRKFFRLVFPKRMVAPSEDGEGFVIPMSDEEMEFLQGRIMSALYLNGETEEE